MASLPEASPVSSFDSDDDWSEEDDDIDEDDPDDTPKDDSSREDEVSDDEVDQMLDEHLVKKRKLSQTDSDAKRETQIQRLPTHIEKQKVVLRSKYQECPLII